VGTLFVDAVRAPLADSSARDDTVSGVIALLLAGALLRVGAALWPSWTAVIPSVAALVPAVVFAGRIGAALAAERPGVVSARSARLGVRVLVVALAHLLVPAATVVAAGYVVGVVSGPVAGVSTAGLATVALVVVAVFAYFLPAAAVTGAREGILAGLARNGRRGAASGRYFVAWAGAAVLVILAWGAVVGTGGRGLAAALALCWFGYAHLAAAVLVREGVERTR